MSLGGNKHEFKNSFCRIAVLHLIVGVPAWGEGVVGIWATDGDKSHVEIASCGLNFAALLSG